MSMPFRQKMPDFIAPCGTHELKQINQADGTTKTVVDDPKLPDSSKFETKNMLAAKIPLDDPRFAEVSSAFTAIPEAPSEPDVEPIENEV